MKFGICANLTRDIDGKASLSLAVFLRDNNVSFAFCDDLKGLNADGEYLPLDTLTKRCDVIIIMGGDGTVLRYAKACAKNHAPVFNVNLGTMGFLSAVEGKTLTESIKRLIDGDYGLETRHLIMIETESKEKFYALNECVVSRGAKAKIIQTEIFVNGYLVDRIKSDAMIVSTPTGSTAYSLSCGGPIVAPDVQGVIITPVSAHSLHARPLVVNETSEIRLRLVSADPCAYVNIDGEDVKEMKSGEVICVTKGDLTLNFVTLNNNNFYNQLHKKLNYWSDIE